MIVTAKEMDDIIKSEIKLQSDLNIVNDAEALIDEYIRENYIDKPLNITTVYPNYDVVRTNIATHTNIPKIRVFFIRNELDKRIIEAGWIIDKTNGIWLTKNF
jgi:hypothetical protein